MMARELTTTTKEHRLILVRRKEEVGTAVSKNRPAVAKTVRPKGRDAGSDTGVGIVAPSESGRSDRGGDPGDRGLSGQTRCNGKNQPAGEREIGSRNRPHGRTGPWRVQ